MKSSGTDTVETAGSNVPASSVNVAASLVACCYPNTPEPAMPIGELSGRSEPFRVKELRHPLVGELSLYCETLKLPSDAGQFLVTYSAQPGSAAAQGRQPPASWGKDVTRAGETAKTHS